MIQLNLCELNSQPTDLMAVLRWKRESKHTHKLRYLAGLIAFVLNLIFGAETLSDDETTIQAKVLLMLMVDEKFDRDRLAVYCSG